MPYDPTTGTWYDDGSDMPPQAGMMPPPSPLNVASTAATMLPPVPPAGMSAPTTTYQPGPAVRRFQTLANQAQALDDNGKPILDPRTGKPIQSPLAANPSWWRTALAGAAEFGLGRRHPGAAQTIGNAIIGGDPRVRAATSLQAELKASKQAADEERLNEQMQGQREYRDVWNRIRLGNERNREQQEQDQALSRIGAAYGRPTPGPPPQMPAPTTGGGAPMTVQPSTSPTMMEPPTVSGGNRPISPVIGQMMRPPTLPAAPGPPAGWTPRKVAGQSFEVPPPEVAAELKQTEVQKNWPTVTEDMAQTLGGGVKVGQPINPAQFPALLKQYEAAKNGPKIEQTVQGRQKLADQYGDGLTAAQKQHYALTGQLPDEASAELKKLNIALAQQKLQENAPPGGTNTPGLDVHGPEFLQTLQPAVANQVKALAEGRMQFPAGFALKSPYWQKMITAVSQYDPSFDAVNYNARVQTRKAFTSGNEAKQVNALQTLAGHLDELSQKADALNNVGWQPINTLKNLVSTKTGSPEVNNFNTVLHKVADEDVRAYRGGGGSEQDIKQRLSDFSTSNSPAQLQGAIAETAKLVESKINALKTQYEQGMGTTADPYRVLTPQTQAVIDKLKAKVEPGSGAAAPGNVPAQGGYQIGHLYGNNLEYLGGDPNNGASWKQH